MPALNVRLGQCFLLPVLLLSLAIMALSLMLDRRSDNRMLGGERSFLEYKTQIRELSQKVALLDGESQRLKALAKRVAVLSGMDIRGFAFDKAAGQGGGEYQGVRDNYPSLELLSNDIKALDDKMLVYSNQLERIQLVLKSHVLRKKEERMVWPVVNGFVSSNYGLRKDPFTGSFRKHRGVDIAAKRGTPVMSIAGGDVIFAGSKGGYGRVVEVDHGEGIVSRYAHLDGYSVKKGDSVMLGDKFATVGSSGRSTGPHLHLEIIIEKQHVNPINYLKGNRSLPAK